MNNSGFYTLFNAVIFGILQFVSVVFMTNNNVADWVYNKRIFNDTFSVAVYAKDYKNLRAQYEDLLQKHSKLYGLLNTQLQDNVNKNFVYDVKTNFKVLSATVINNITTLNKNYITIDKGYRCGVKENMSVFTDEGFIGIIACVGEYYSTIIPLLHDNFYVAAQLSNSKATGTVKWDGKNYRQTRLLYVPNHIKVEIGEEVVTSGFNSSICPNLLIGTVESIEGDSTSFHTIVVNLKNDFNRLHNVYVMENDHTKSKFQVEQKTIQQYG